MVLGLAPVSRIPDMVIFGATDGSRRTLCAPRAGVHPKAGAHGEQAMPAAIALILLCLA
jgi:hypothetical protein